ncbi:hypothetical protein D3P96_01345 [Weissella viridescens]|uniref:Uncharacterized protein n=1 Tax=Weissella viridescens TaxID=1629 RepID=A0A3P2RD35_WEIVI|nr:hypothetical protein [Weissella viridescens]RRG18659.1 hypothetical protein D3P96_01345 [Weissella viridescens]
MTNDVSASTSQTIAPASVVATQSTQALTSTAKPVATQINVPQNIQLKITVPASRNYDRSVLEIGLCIVKE